MTRWLQHRRVSYHPLFHVSRRDFDDAVTVLECVGYGVLAVAAGIGVWQIATFVLWAVAR
jgi:hypothetical protein